MPIDQGPVQLFNGMDAKNVSKKWSFHSDYGKIILADYERNDGNRKIYRAGRNKPD
jgi:hypothetical protein